MTIEMTSLEEAGLHRPQVDRLLRHLESYVDAGKIPGFAILVARDDAVALRHHYGMADLATQTPVSDSTIYRIYSMTKPITSTALLMLAEAGMVDLNDEVGDYIPSFKAINVLKGGSTLEPMYRPATEPVRVWHLLTHTAGLTYGFHNQTILDTLYRQHASELNLPDDLTLEELVDRYAQLGLLFDPGHGWNYSVATDVLGRLIEVISGEPLSAALETMVLQPLEMTDTTFELNVDQLERVGALYLRTEEDGMHHLGGAVPERRVFPVDMGGGGLFSTLDDYLRFTLMLMHRGSFGGVRLLGPRTVDLMTANHLPGGADVVDLCRYRPQPIDEPGVGFGLGVSVVNNPAAAKNFTIAGEFGWGGMASTNFFISPKDQLSVIFMTQLIPSSAYSFGHEIHRLLIPALTS
ncbi:serine hydrolase domain-containing protein [Ferrimicrobium acidiphilum]|uniref:Esterase EstB n=1 Tax=Ferrimicrobium acidiphilum DSM 19497 TaxID=1121877 RepID=A0A0D8FW47_9ACTN|nr:serine hydrolase domain-containing protein [Ferrimicrobium acidiphilum]KJE77518.1 esterase EstB [Ferrimicrobium acidiphilum DSM 19497]MCL5053884.1 beta-lactamase family protein [Gammaproteobacteria bacterium]